MIVTNMLGVAFTATLLSASDAGATFVFPEDGATNVLAWSQLATCSQEAVCDTTGFAPVPPALAAVFQTARRDLKRLDAFETSHRLQPGEFAHERAAILRAFEKKCRTKGVPPHRTTLLLKRIEQ